MRRRRAVPLLVLFAASLPGVSLPPGAASAGAAAKAVSRTEFDVVSIRVHKDTDEDSSVSLDWGGDRFVARDESLKDVLELAYDIEPGQVIGIPGALDRVRFDIEAKLLPDDAGIAAKLTDKQLQRLLPSMLAERFALKAHLETKTRPVYELEVAKGGLKMLPAKPDEKYGTNVQLGGGTMQIKATACSISDLIDFLEEEQIVHRTVIDKTDMPGAFDFSLTWAAEDSAGDDLNGDGSIFTGVQEQLIFTGVQEQLGLKLLPAKGPVRMLVVDRVEMPTAN